MGFKELQKNLPVFSISVVTKIGENTFIVTNTREPEKTFVEGAKTWNDKDNQDGKRPTEITINLLKNGTKIAEEAFEKLVESINKQRGIPHGE